MHSVFSWSYGCLKVFSLRLKLFGKMVWLFCLSEFTSDKQRKPPKTKQDTKQKQANHILLEGLSSWTVKQGNHKNCKNFHSTLIFSVEIVTVSASLLGSCTDITFAVTSTRIPFLLCFHFPFFVSLERPVFQDPQCTRRSLLLKKFH